MRAPPAGVPADAPTAVESVQTQRALARIRDALLAGPPGGAPPDVVAAHTNARSSLGGVPVAERLERTRMNTHSARRREAAAEPSRLAADVQPATEPRAAPPVPGFVAGLLVGFMLGRRGGRRSRR